MVTYGYSSSKLLRELLLLVRKLRVLNRGGDWKIAPIEWGVLLVKHTVRLWGVLVTISTYGW